MKHIFFVVIFLVITGNNSPHAREDACKLHYGIERDIKFAHCDNAERSYKVAFLAIHGWSGTCATTFGKKAQSLFSVMTPNRFGFFPLRLRGALCWQCLSRLSQTHWWASASR